MTTVSLPLTTEEQRWLDDWSVMAGYKSASEGIKEVLKTCGAIPRGSDYFKSKFPFAE
ncbi:hypothetical protein OAL60_00565 [bacterium]|nr:hypothetical protein [bacterium]